MKSILSIVKILFLALLLSANAIGFHYYFTPVATESLKYVPENSEMVFTVNLKSISGKLFQEAIFNSDVFEKDLISKDEKSLVWKNTDYGINPIGLVSFFIFPFSDELVPGASLNLQDNEQFIEEMEENNFKSHTVDGVVVYESEKNTFFVYEKALVILFDKFQLNDREDLAVEILQNENLSLEWNTENDFQLITKRGLLKGTLFASFFRLIPDFIETLVMDGTFETGKIKLKGNLKVNPKLKVKNADGFLTEKSSIPKDSPFSFGLSGEKFGYLYSSFLSSVFDEEKDTSGRMAELVSEKYHSLNISMDKIILDVDILSIGADLLTGKWFDPAYEVKMNLTSTQKMDSISVENFLEHNNGTGKERKISLNVNKSNQLPIKGYFYFHPSRFIENSDMNMFIKGVIDPFVIFEEIYLMMDKIDDNKIFYNGEITFKDNQVHALIQLRLLFKNLSSMI